MNAFQVYAHHNEIYLHVKQHTDNSQKWIVQLISKQKADQYDLDLLHKILKHTRSCHLCPAKQLMEEIKSFILSQLDISTQKPTLPLLVCLMDLVKNHALACDHWLIEMACSLWYEPSINTVRKAMELCRRVQDRLEEADVTLVTHILRYISHCQSSLDMQDIDRFRSGEYTEFFYTPTSIVCDRECIKLLVQIILSLLFKLSNHAISQQLTDKAQEIYALNPSAFLPLLFDICCANDDDTIQILNTVLLLFQERPETHVFFESLQINPHILFTFFVYRCGSSHDILIDLLLENDSDFLSYFHQYIIYAQKDISTFKSSLTYIDLDTIQAILINTIRVLEGNGFPYNTKPLIKRLTQLQDQLFGV
ncbi:hypothetical protein G6F62_002725 [Rhizopus arrhizus]|nr:hypothetical protein G6F23_000361 [Rhizopus arrhizus]KAG0768424.1 hypothetical protein G6F24_001946 [Rhizopus arrhizus]KAG0795504.1 hypothetical protein G6F21_002046 [Rhizopus arrhizus]KAG0817394.1 hypothetical protein G6F20_002427 [Rhizopus arrhizus]KAG0838968.1 hypothetical protein G6F19_002830 [Rhizopus arrhizus]